MKVAQGLITALLCLLLFICLSVFGVGLIINTTALNADFVSGQVKNMELAEITRDVIEREDLLELPSEIEFARPYIYNTLDDYEPWLHDQVDLVIGETYHYLRGERQTFNIAISMAPVKTTLKPKLWEEAQDNLAAVVIEILKSDLPPSVEQYIEEYIYLVPPELLPPGALNLPPEQIIDLLRGYLNRTNLTIMMAAAPELRGLLEEVVAIYFDQYVDDFIDDIPDDYVLDEDELGPDMTRQLEDARRYIGYFRTGFYALIGVAVVLMAAVVLVYRRTMEVLLSLGITFALFGAVTLSGTVFARTLTWVTYLPDDVPAAVRSGLTGTIGEALEPLLWYSIGILVVGIVMIVLGVLFRRREEFD